MGKARLAPDRMSEEQLLDRIVVVAHNIEQDYWHAQTTRHGLMAQVTQIEACVRELRLRGQQMALNV